MNILGILLYFRSSYPASEFVLSNASKNSLLRTVFVCLKINTHIKWGNMQKCLQSSRFVSQLDTSTVTIQQFRRKFTESFIGYFIRKGICCFHRVNHITGTRVSVSDKVRLMTFRVPQQTHCYIITSMYQKGHSMLFLLIVFPENCKLCLNLPN